MHIQSVAVSDVGKQRDHNEDACLDDREHGLFIVADGMGGAAAGEVASALAVERIAAFFRPRVAELRTGELGNPAFRQRLARLAEAAVVDANHHVFQAATDDQSGKVGMGTTLTVLLLLDRVAVVAHVGDSRMYLKRNDTLYPLTQDHSFVNEMVQRGVLSEEDALQHPMANLLTRAVGPQANVQPDVNVLDVYNGDVFFLCSDGVTKGVGEQEMLTLMTSEGGDLATACTRLIQAANDAGGDDNATVVLVHVDDDVDVSAPHERFVDSKMQALKELPLFAGLGHSELLAVANLAGDHEYRTGDSIVAAGEVSPRFFVLLKGRVVLCLHGAEVLDVHPGVHFGDVECFDGKPAMLEARAVTPVQVLTFERAHIEDLCRRDPALGVQLLWRFTTSLSHRVDEVLRRGTLTE